jgi:hypothetical protein
MNNDDDSLLPSEELEKLFFQSLDELDNETRLAFQKLIVWKAERPKGSLPLTKDQFEQMLEEVKLENIRRRLGGKVGEIRTFSRTAPKE